MNDGRLSYLMSYLHQLTLLQQAGVNLYGEIDAVTEAINNELGLNIRQGRAK